MITEKAYAKINISLDVIGKRPDGYHDVSMIMQQIGLHDLVRMKIISEDKILLKTNRSFLPTDERNIAYKAAEAFKKRFDIQKGIFLDIEKQIPVAAGLAGGSTNAAATLRGMNKLFEINASLDELCEIGVKLGADVPYCIKGGTMLSEGIGEILTPVENRLNCYCVLVKPDFPVSTQYVYQNLVLGENTKHPDINSVKNAVQAGDLHALAACAGNILETVTCNKYPVIEEIKKGMRDAGAELAMMSGSGPTVFGLFSSKTKAQKCFMENKLGPYGAQTFLTCLCVNEYL